MDPIKLLTDIGTQVKHGFVANRRILSFAEYLSFAEENSSLQARSSAQYLRDMFDHYGTETVQAHGTTQTHYKLFDCEFDGGRERVIGQETVQHEIYKILSNFVRERRVTKLIFLHGPNGSAKSTIISAIMRGLANYSHTEEGALYRYNWIFPTGRTTKGGIGFGDSTELTSIPTFAHLLDEQIDARIKTEMRDHPLFLLPSKERQVFLEAALAKDPRGKGFILSDYLRFGNLDHKSKAIFEALLTSYQGDYLKVLRHVQVERFYLSRRYKEGLVTVEPQMSVDAGMRQITMDRSIGSLPAALQNTTMFESHGELIDANRGLLEFNDILKRPIEAFKYLLSTCEKATVSLENAILYLDEVFIATANEKQLDAFKSIPDFQSFKGRIELVKAPYLLRASVEKKIYDDHVTPESVPKPIAPHTTEVVALWAVMTRLMKPLPEKYPSPLKELVAKLSPRDKLRLYDHDELPDGLSAQGAREMKGHISDIWRESRNYPNYEGRQGASPREVKTLLMNAAQNKRYECLSPLAVFDELEELVKQRSVYEFLQQEVVDGYHDHARFIEDVRQQYLDVLDTEVRLSTGLVEESLYDTLFEKYITHVSHWLKKEKLRNKLTGAYENPDEDFMNEIESALAKPGENKPSFRQGVINHIAAWKIDHPTDTVSYQQLFPKHTTRLREAYYERNKKTVQKNAEDLLKYLAGEKSSMEESARKQSELMLGKLRDRFGYCEACARDVVAYLLKKRYA